MTYSEDMQIVYAQIKAKAVKVLLLSVGVSVIVSLFVFRGVSAHPKGLVYPVIGPSTYSNDFTSPRASGAHNATDIMAPKMSKVIAAVEGVVTYVPLSQPSWGYMITIKDKNNFTYDYIHLNNDTPGTDDGNGGPYNAYAPDIQRGATVYRGQHIGYVGDSGNAESTASHLHLEITSPQGEKINPYPYLLEAERLSVPNPYPAVGAEILPYGSSIFAPTSIAVGRFTPNQEKTGLIVGTGKGYSPHVRGLNQDNTEKFGFYAYGVDFTGGVDVASGDVDGDGVDEIITGTRSGAPHVRVFKQNGSVLASFYAFSPSFTGGVSVSSIDIDNDGTDEILVGAGAGGSPHVRVLRLNGEEVLGFYAYALNYYGGVDVASGDVHGDERSEIVTTPGPGGSAHLRIFNNIGVPLGVGFNAYEAYTGYTGGARVSVGDALKGNQKDEILVGPWNNGGPHFRLLRSDGAVVKEGYYYESWWSGNYDVALGDGVSYVTTGETRRSSIRSGPR